jgi:hypothetical protein
MVFNYTISILEVIYHQIRCEDDQMTLKNILKGDLSNRKVYFCVERLKLSNVAVPWLSLLFNICEVSDSTLGTDPNQID